MSQFSNNNIVEIKFSNHDSHKGRRKAKFSYHSKTSTSSPLITLKKKKLLALYFNVVLNPKPLHYH